MELSTAIGLKQATVHLTLGVGLEIIPLKNALKALKSPSLSNHLILFQMLRFKVANLQSLVVNLAPKLQPL
jgi:hypothetical protein